MNGSYGVYNVMWVWSKCNLDKISEIRRICLSHRRSDRSFIFEKTSTATKITLIRFIFCNIYISEVGLMGIVRRLIQKSKGVVGEF